MISKSAQTILKRAGLDVAAVLAELGTDTLTVAAARRYVDELQAKPEVAEPEPEPVTTAEAGADGVAQPPAEKPPTPPCKWLTPDPPLQVRAAVEALVAELGVEPVIRAWQVTGGRLVSFLAGGREYQAILNRPLFAPRAPAAGIFGGDA